MSLQKAAARYVAAPSPRTEAAAMAAAETRLHALCRILLRRNPSPDELQDARLGTLNALRAYKPERAQFTTVMPFYIRKALFRVSRRLIVVPEYLLLLRNKLDTYLTRALYTHDRQPCDAEICEALSLTRKQLEELRSLPMAYFYTTQWREREDADEEWVDHREYEDIWDQLVLREEGYEQAEREEDVQEAIAALEEINPDAAQVVRLSLLESRSERSIAALLRISNNTAKRRLDEAQYFLRQRLSAYA